MAHRTPAAFRALIYKEAKKYHRTLPWRKTIDPYRILVSEIMLQQTQVDRVIPKYRAFLKRFPSIRVLSRAPLGDVLRQWQGLGYNRRAKMLHACAREVALRHGGTLPNSFQELVALPGIGPYTAGAILAFAYNMPHPIIETNIRTVYLHHFFAKTRTKVLERHLLFHIEKTLDRRNPRKWYTALMDYGSALKRIHGNPNSRSRSYVRQSRFKGSSRQVRGGIVRALVAQSATEKDLELALKKEGIAIAETPLQAQLASLAAEGLIMRRGKRWNLAS